MKHKGLSRFCITVLVILASVAIVDVTLGKTMDRLLPQISGRGDTGKTYYSLYDVNSSIVIVGSSRAAHHYVTNMIEDSLGMSAYNVGRNGCYFSYNCCIINSIIDRYNPQLIIWENDFNYLNDSISDPLEALYPFYDSNKWATKAISEEMGNSECVKLNSKLYQYNSIIHRIISQRLKKQVAKTTLSKGYEPMPYNNKNTNLQLTELSSDNKELSSRKISRFKNTLERVLEKGIKILLVDSPKYYNIKSDNKSKRELLKICADLGIEYLDYTQLPQFLSHRAYFYDHMHLNDSGAKEYTSYFLKNLNKIELLK